MISKSSIHRQDSGFTLTELMIAAFISISVVAFGGWGVATIISSSKTNESQNERRGELNRALDFMAAEIRESVNINSDIGSPAPTEFASSLNATSEEVNKDSIQEILRLQVPGLSRPVIYYIASPSATNLTWRGPKVVYRWGPAFDSAGHYDVKAATSTWTHAPLIDALENTDSTETCPKDWKPAPESGATGFYACIDPSNKIAQLHSIGRVNKVLDATVPYPANSQAFARTAVLPVLPSSVGSGVITLPTASTTTMKILGSAIQCGKGAPAPPPMNTQLVINKVTDGQTVSSTTLTVDPNALPAIPSYEHEPAGTTFNFTGSIPPESQNPNNTCNAEKYVGPVNSLDNSVQVKILRNGEAVPDVKGFAGSVSAKDILNSYLDPLGTTIKLEANQYIILFELGVKDDTSSDAFDLQDLVVLATVNPV
jgi:type II secretory pathway component PulJ/peptidoglycan hydrolase-like protein with peptidoglycan-binding domain